MAIALDFSIAAELHQKLKSRWHRNKAKENLLENRVANVRLAPIVRTVNWNWKWFRAGAFVALLALGAAGCSGIHASKSVSPATFLLPGLLKNETPAAQDSIPAAPPGELLAQN